MNKKRKPLNKIKKTDNSGALSWSSRIFILAIFALSGFLAAWFVLEYLADWLIGKFAGELAQNNLFAGALALTLFAFINGIGVWMIRTFDQKKQFQDSLQQQKETLFSNALGLLLNKDDILARSVGLKELLQLRAPANKERIDSITSADLDLKDAKLQEAKLQDANLQGANLQDAKLQEAKLQEANLEGANLQGADLFDANLEGANLQKANLFNVNLQKANLFTAELEGANLQGAKLQKAKLQDANLEGANLQGAGLFDANLEEANLQGAELQDAGLSNIVWNHSTKFNGASINQKTLSSIIENELLAKIKEEAIIIG